MRISKQLQETLEKSGWLPHLRGYFMSPDWDDLSSAIKEIAVRDNICPEPQDVVIFRALIETPLSAVKCVIVGQDPYPTPGTANGLAFAVNPGRVRPASLSNIVKEVELDVGVFIPKNKSTLLGWTKQGVLLLNSVLTVTETRPNSHLGFGWEGFTDLVLNIVAEQQERVAFLLWGKYAQDKMANMSGTSKFRRNHLILTAAHPSPQSAHQGFFGSHHFTETNKFLKRHNIEPIDWSKVDISDLDDNIRLPVWTDKDDFYERRYLDK